MKRGREVLLTAMMLLCCAGSMAQKRFFNLTADEVRIDSLLPSWTHFVPLDDVFADSTYTVELLYPEFIDMSSADEDRCRKICGERKLPEMPEVKTTVSVDRKRGVLRVQMVPIVEREGKLKKLVSFMLSVEGKARKKSVRRQNASRRANAADRYAEHSVLAQGRWAKIRVPQSGIYELTDAVVKKAGFTDLSHVKLYGYGGKLQNEQLVAEDLIETDDLKEVATCNVGGRRLFHAQGPVSWESNTADKRTRNPYSMYGYYLITQSTDEPLTVDSAAFVNSFYPTTDDFHTLYEPEEYSVYHGGRNLFASEEIGLGTSKSYTISVPEGVTAGQMTVAMVSGGKQTRIEVSVNGEEAGQVAFSSSIFNLNGLDRANEAFSTFAVNNLQQSNTVTLTVSQGSASRLDYISIRWDNALPVPSLSKGKFNAPEYVYNITNQDLHADRNYQMVMIIPATQKLRQQAERLKAFHEQNDGLTVRIVPADELYNEFSSGTPDANAYRRYMKMLYDRADNDEQAPKYLLLFGDCAWDNRMVSRIWQAYNPDDFLLGFQSEDSFNEATCFVDEAFFGYLDDGEGINPWDSDMADVAVGRFPVRTAEEAKVMVDKTISYIENQNAGAWQNTVMFMGDDGNNNTHMRDINEAAGIVETRNPAIVVKKVYWDAYKRVTTSTGNTYPEAEQAIKQQQKNGALIMDYAGHAAANFLSHEGVLKVGDFQNFTNANLPLWITAACDVMPFDGQTDNIGEAAVLNAKGGAVAFLGTSRTVYTNKNRAMNLAFLREQFASDNGKYASVGEALRRAKNYLVEHAYLSNGFSDNPDGDYSANKMCYALLGDPALTLHIPTLRAVIDSINGLPTNSGILAEMKAGSLAKVSGHIESNGTTASDFNGMVSLTVRDSEQQIVCKLNSPNDASYAFRFYDRNKTLFNGTDSVSNGRFSMSFAVPLDLNYSDESGMINVYAVSTDKQRLANGYNQDFVVGGTDVASNDSIGPNIYCYLNTPDFQNGGNVNTTPFFVAQISDKDGLNTAGTSIGHDLELIIDGEMTKTYNLNENFRYDFGSYTSGTTSYQIPALTEGTHQLRFRAWDVLNNSSVASLSFNVVKGLQPNYTDIAVSQNPARSNTTFIVNHDRNGSNVDVMIEVFDMSGRLLWQHTDTDYNASGSYTYDWNLTTDTGAQMQTGVYLYRVCLTCDGATKTSKAKKLVIIN